MEFILPSAVVLTSFRPSVVPVLGLRGSVGIDDENRQDSREYADDFYKGQTDSFAGRARAVHDPDHDHRARPISRSTRWGSRRRGYRRRTAGGRSSGRAIIR